jgi:hypothetical protein
MTKNWSSTSSKASSFTTSSFEASYVSLIISMRCIIMRSLVILWLHIIVLRWCCTLLRCIIMVLQTVVHYCTIVLLETVSRDYTMVVVHCYIIAVAHCLLRMLHRLSCYMFNLHHVCICNPFFHHLQGSKVLVFMSN